MLLCGSRYRLNGNITTFGSSRGDRHLGSRDCTKVMPIITEVRGRSEPDIAHLPRPECLVEDRINHSINEIDDAGESKTIEEYDDGCLRYRQKAERVDPSCGDGEGVSPCTDIHGDGSLEKVGSDDDDSRSEAMLSHDGFGRHFSLGSTRMLASFLRGSLPGAVAGTIL